MSAETPHGRGRVDTKSAVLHRAAVTAASSPTGLTSEEACRRLTRLGPNTVAEEAQSSFTTLFEKFWGPVPWLLEAAIAVQLALGAYVEAAVIGSLLLFNAALGVCYPGGSCWRRAGGAQEARRTDRPGAPRR
jgi:H+-transporting ATPase